MIVTYIADRALYRYLTTAINSLLCTNPDVDKIYLFVEDDTLPFIHHPKIEIMNLNNYDFPKIPMACSSQYPYTATARLFLDSALTESKVIYLDVDTIVHDNLQEMWDLDLSSCYVAARKETPEYYNSGVLLMNLQYMREHNSASQLIEVLKSRRFDYPDQTAMNIVFKDHIKDLPDKFNVFERSDIAYKKEVAIRHYAGIYKPWLPSADAADIAFYKSYYCDFL